MNGSTGTVGFDGFYLNFSTTGSGQYATQLWRTLNESVDEFPGIRLLQPDLGDPRSAPLPEAQTIAAPAGMRRGKAAKLWWEQRGIVKAARNAGVQVIHTPYFAAPLKSEHATIITIHDVIPLVLPEYRSSLAMRAYLSIVSRAARNARAILTDSSCSRDDIERHLGIDRSRITVIPLAADDRYRPARDPETEREIRYRMDLPGPIVFNVGGLDVRKNVPALIRAFARALPQIDPNTRLVIAGHAHSDNTRLYPPVQPLIRELGLVGKVILPGRITEEDKLLLYNIADLYVFTSLYEGFGLSPLEAMACGTPVVSSNRSSIPEVVGEGGMLVEPDEDAISSAIAAMMTDDDLRRRMGQRGLEQASTFSWEQTAAMTRDVYRQVLAGEAHGA